jgi:type IV pilus assembly protein PilC
LNRFKYKAINQSGRPVRGVLTAANESDLYNQLQAAGLELIDCAIVKDKKGVSGRLFKKVKIRELIQFFLHLEQMQAAGIPILDSLADIRDTADNDLFRDIVSEMYREVSEGSSFSEAMASQPKAFNSLHVSLISAGEENGDIRSSCRQLITYLKWVDEMQVRVRKATRYPMILMFAVIATVVIMMAYVVPQIVSFIKTLDQELPWATTSLMAVSDFFVEYWLWVLIVPLVVIALCVSLFRVSDGFAYRMDALFLQLPIMGDLIRKINIARFSQTFGALFKGGIDILSALEAASKTVRNRVLKESLSSVREYVKEGDPLSQALNKTGEYPSMVVRMVKVGEESGNLTVVLDQVSEFYTNDVDEEVQKIIAMIEPSLTAILGGIILWIAVGVFGPIYASFETINF